MSSLVLREADLMCWGKGENPSLSLPANSVSWHCRPEALTVCKALEKEGTIFSQLRHGQTGLNLEPEELGLTLGSASLWLTVLTNLLTFLCACCLLWTMEIRIPLYRVLVRHRQADLKLLWWSHGVTMSPYFCLHWFSSFISHPGSDASSHLLWLHLKDGLYLDHNIFGYY